MNFVAKNQFTGNRLKDIKQSVEVRRESYNVGVNFRYVHTSENPDDLISRGISQEKLKTI